MKPTSIAGLYECMDQWGDSPVTKRTCKRIAHKADRKHGRQVAKNWQDDYQDVWSFWGDDPIGGLDYGYSEDYWPYDYGYDYYPCQCGICQEWENMR